MFQNLCLRKCVFSFVFQDCQFMKLEHRVKKNRLLLYRLTFYMVSSDAFLLCHNFSVSSLLLWTSTLNKLTAAQKEYVNLHLSVNALIWEMGIRIHERALMSGKWDILHPVLNTLPMHGMILVWIWFLWCARCSTENNKETHKICVLASSSLFLMLVCVWVCVCPCVHIYV